MPKSPSPGLRAVLAYLSRYTHRIAIANSRLQSIDKQHVSFTFNDYQREGNNMHKTMTLDTHEFMRRFMLHVLPSGFHCIRHYGLLASPTKQKKARRLLNMAEPQPTVETDKTDDEPASFECRKCHSPLQIMAIREPAYLPRAPPSTKDK